MTLLRPTIEYIPEELRDLPLYQTVCTLLDGARRRSTLDLIDPLDSIITDLIRDYRDEEAVLAYYNMFVRPSIGSRSSLMFVLRLLNIDARLVEWFDADFNLPPFKFSLDFDEYPAGLNIDRLIDLVNLVRNERGRLAVIRQPEDFQDVLILDNSNLDDALLDDVSGVLYRGVNIFLNNKHNTGWSGSVLRATGTTVTSVLNTGWTFYLGEIVLDDYQFGMFVERPAVEVSRLESIEIFNDLTQLTTNYLAHHWLGEDFFKLSESTLDGDDFFPARVSYPVDSLGVSNFKSWYLDEDLILDDVTWADQIQYYSRQSTQGRPLVTVSSATMHTEEYVRYVSFSHYSRSDIVLNDYHLDDFNASTKIVKSVLPLITDAARSTYFEITSIIPRYGIGQPTGGVREYKVASYTSHRSE